MTDKQYIKENVSTDDLLTQLAEEASELSQAALKFRRAGKYGGTPTNVTFGDALDGLMEEIADVINSVELVLDIDVNLSADRGTIAQRDINQINGIRERKLKRFVQRVRAQEDKA